MHERLTNDGGALCHPSVSTQMRARDATTDAETEDENEADVDVDVDADARETAAATRIGRVTLTLASSSFHHVSRGEDARVRPRLDA